ncbi:tetratricopeptide repeat protein [Candidatus Uhrbacteria bacterium]|jgi:tetratricopeptide (TPR) repeat protein|nr:tetratricopeptide repeat protein [Candidatus Uhrbacteria bacterium]
MKARIRITIIAIAAALIGVIAWQATSDNGLLTTEEYPGFINHEDLDIPEDVAAQWNIQLNTSEAAYANDPKDINALLNTSFWKRQLGDYAESRRAVEKSLEANPINFTAWTMLGDVAVNMEDWETAEASYIKSLELHTDPNLYYKIEKVWRSAFPERYNDIEVLYQDAISEDGQNPLYLTKLADWYAEQERWQEAADHVKVVTELMPEDEGAQADYEMYLEKAKANK